MMHHGLPVVTREGPLEERPNHIGGYDEDLLREQLSANSKSFVLRRRGHGPRPSHAHSVVIVGCGGVGS